MAEALFEMILGTTQLRGEYSPGSKKTLLKETVVDIHGARCTVT